MPNGLTTCTANAVAGTTAAPSRSCVTAPTGRARCTSGSRAPRWPPRTRSASRRSSSPSSARRDRANGGLTLAPGKVEQILKKTATDTPCPAQEPFVYPFEATRPATFTATCEGNAQFNGFYGEGIVNAAAAVGAGNRGRN